MAINFRSQAECRFLMKVPGCLLFFLGEHLLRSLPSPSWYIRTRWLNNFANKHAPQRLMGAVWVSINYCNRRQVLIKYDRTRCSFPIPSTKGGARAEGRPADNKQSFCLAAKSCLRDAKVFCWSPVGSGEHIKIKSDPCVLRTRAPETHWRRRSFDGGGASLFLISENRSSRNASVQ